MQSLHSASKSAPGQACADAVMLSVPPVVWFMRRNMRSHRGQLSLPQFRARCASSEATVSITEIAEHLGTALSTTSRLVSGLVSRGLLARDASRIDRRQMSVTITAKRSLRAEPRPRRDTQATRAGVPADQRSRPQRAGRCDDDSSASVSETNGLPKNGDGQATTSPSPRSRMSSPRNNRLN